MSLVLHVSVTALPTCTALKHGHGAHTRPCQEVNWCYLMTRFTIVEFIEDFLAFVNNLYDVVGLFNDMLFNECCMCCICLIIIVMSFFFSCTSTMFGI